MSTILKSRVDFAGVEPGDSLRLPHSLNVNGSPVEPNMIMLTPSTDFMAVADKTHLEVFNVSGSVASCSAFCEHWHTIESVLTKIFQMFIVEAQCPVPLPPTPTVLSPTNFPQSVASGDPRTNSVVLWTRIIDPTLPIGNRAVRLQVSTHSDFRNAVVNSTFAAELANDNTVRVRVAGLLPGTRYYYRFLYGATAPFKATKVGRTKTAPPVKSRGVVRFATVADFSFTGNFFNPLLRLLQPDVVDDLDFLLFTGLYIFQGEASNPNEFDGNNLFLGNGPNDLVTWGRRIRPVGPPPGPQGLAPYNFDEGGPSSLWYDYYSPSQTTDPGSRGKHYKFAYAANAGNYRQIYKLTRSDEVLQEIHEKFPIICMVQDHDFMPKHWQDRANNSMGRLAFPPATAAQPAYLQPPTNIPTNEVMTSVLQAAQQVFFEYMPIDAVGGTVTTEIPTATLYPNVERIYRDFRFGRTLQLFVEDTRSYRPDHLIPEDKFPGAVAVDEQGIIDVGNFLGFPGGGAAFLAAVDPLLDYYGDISGVGDTMTRAGLNALLQGAYKLANLNFLPSRDGDFDWVRDLNGANYVQRADEAIPVVPSGPVLRNLNYLNRLIQQYNMLGALGFWLPPLPASLPYFSPAAAGVKRGICFFPNLNKSDLYSVSGAYTTLPAQAFGIYGTYRGIKDGNPLTPHLTASQSMLDAFNLPNAPQFSWLANGVAMSQAQWKIICPVVQHHPAMLDFGAPLPAKGPGFPNFFAPPSAGIGVSAPGGGNVVSITMASPVAPQRAFSAGDIGSKVWLFDPANPGNNGPFLVINFTDNYAGTTTIEFVNPAGVVNPTCIWSLPGGYGTSGAAGALNPIGGGYMALAATGPGGAPAFYFTDIGRTITISGAINPVNNGTGLITGGIPGAFPGTFAAVIFANAGIAEAPVAWEMRGGAGEVQFSGDNWAGMPYGNEAVLNWLGTQPGTVVVHSDFHYRAAIDRSATPPTETTGKPSEFYSGGICVDFRGQLKETTAALRDDAGNAGIYAPNYTAKSGSGAFTAVAAGVFMLTMPVATFDQTDIGRPIQLSGAWPYNNGMFVVNQVLSATQVIIHNKYGNNDTVAWVLAAGYPEEVAGPLQSAVVEALWNADDVYIQAASGGKIKFCVDGKVGVTLYKAQQNWIEVRYIMWPANTRQVRHYASPAAFLASATESTWRLMPDRTIVPA